MSFKCVNYKRIALTIDATKPISATRIFTPDFEVYVLAGNTGANVYVGDSTVDNTWTPRPKGQYFTFTHGSGEKNGPDAKLEFDLSRVFIASDNAADQVIVQYICGEVVS